MLVGAFNPSRGLLRDCTTGCETDGALHSTSPVAVSKYILMINPGAGQLRPAITELVNVENHRQSHLAAQPPPANGLFISEKNDRIKHFRASRCLFSNIWNQYFTRGP